MNEKTRSAGHGGVAGDTPLDLSKAVQELFRGHFGSAPDAVFQAPGRVNLIGEHTDYNQGFVLPCAINRHTWMALQKRPDDEFHVLAGNIDGQASQWRSQLPIAADPQQSWSNYLRGVNEQLLLRGLLPSGMNVAVLGNIPQGAGLSSSAALTVAFATAINELCGLGLTPAGIALLCQAAENQFVGCNCGIMDQLISAAGRRGHALLIDCRDTSFRSIALPADADVLIINSNVTRGLVDSAYNERRRQCEAAASALGVASLREAELAQLEAGAAKMDATVFRRARHIITENARTLAAAEALPAGDFATLSRLMLQSHVSMRDDFAITTSQIDALVDIVHRCVGWRAGVRMTGGGFGGCVVSVAPRELREAIVEAVTQEYPVLTGLTADIYSCTAGSGAGRVSD